MKRLLTLIVAILVFATVLTPVTIYAEETEETNYELFDTYTLLNDFVTTHPKRVAGTEKERNAAYYLKGKFEAFGLNSTLQDFDFVNESGSYESSQNVIATLSATQSSGQVIIGAHYDNVGLGEGAFDNGSGVAVLLNLAQRLSTQSLPFDVVFVAFGAEESGLFGSGNYVTEMTEGEINSTLCMINLDSISAGEQLYLYGEDVSTNYVKFFLDVSNTVEHGESVLEKRGSKDVVNVAGFGYPYYQTAQASDHSSFRQVGIPTLFFYSGNYSLFNIGYTENQTNESIMHTTTDTVENLKSICGIGFVKKMETVSDTVFKALTNENFGGIISTAREEMVDDIWIATWLPSAIALCVLVVFLLLGIAYLNKLNKRSILEVTEVKKEKFFDVTRPDDIFKL